MPRSRTRIHPPAIALLAAFALLAATPPARAQVELTLIADADTPVPGFPMETFSDFGEGLPVISGSDVSFYGAYPSGSGIYVGDGTALETVANRTTDDPDGSAETFESFRDGTWIDAPYVGFVGSLLSDPGIYLSDGSAITTVVERGDPVPDSMATFEDFFELTLSGNVVAFVGESSGGAEGIYAASGALVLPIVNDATPIPGGSGETFSSFENPIVSGSEVAFLGGSFMAGRTGVYVSGGGPLTVVADDTTSPPGSAGTFTAFVALSFDDGVVAFVGAGLGFEGIYLSNGTDLFLVADTSTPRPGGGTFTNFSDVALSQGNVLFRAGDELFFWSDGTVQRVLGAGDVIDGKTVDAPFIGPGALDGRLFAAEIDFADDSVALYLGEIAAEPLGVPEVPTLGEWGLLLLALSIAAAAAFVLRGRA